MARPVEALDVLRRGTDDCLADHDDEGDEEADDAGDAEGVAAVVCSRQPVKAPSRRQPASDDHEGPALSRESLNRPRRDRPGSFTGGDRDFVTVTSDTAAGSGGSARATSPASADAMSSLRAKLDAITTSRE